MGIGRRFLPHRVSILRHAPVLDELGDPVVDDYGNPVRTTDTIASDVAAGIQPRSAREVAALHEAGAVISDTRIYLLPRDVTTADAVYHDPTACPASPDLPEATYNLVNALDAAGAGHHIQVDAKLVANPGAAYATPVGAENGS